MVFSIFIDFTDKMEMELYSSYLYPKITYVEFFLFINLNEKTEQNKTKMKQFVVCLASHIWVSKWLKPYWQNRSDQFDGINLDTLTLGEGV
jgi:hypothetical protein